MQYIAQAKCGSQLWSVEAHAAAQGRFYISKYFPPCPWVLGTHPILQMTCAALSAGIINKQKYAYNSTQLSARKMGIKYS